MIAYLVKSKDYVTSMLWRLCYDTTKSFDNLILLSSHCEVNSVVASRQSKYGGFKTGQPVL